MKTCSKCGQEKPFSEFHKDAQRGYKPACKACRKAESVARYAENAERLRAEQARKYRENPEKRNAATAAWRERNAEKVKAAALAIAAPKAQALDRIAADDKALTVTQAAKVLGVKREALTTWLSANGWMYRQNGSWVAYQQHIQNGRLLYKEARYTDENTGQEVYRPYCHITPKGLAKLAQAFGREVPHG